LQLQREGVDARSVRCAVHVPGTANYILIGDGQLWDLRSDEDGDTTADVTITATRSALVRFLTAPPLQKPRAEGLDISGKPSAIRDLLKAIEVFPPRSHTACTRLRFCSLSRTPPGEQVAAGSDGLRLRRGGIAEPFTAP
jgi:hypothetical protein